MSKLVVLGSLNVDSILHIERLPLVGETMEMSDKSSAPGGKGANQAVAAARAGAQTAFIGKVGADEAADLLKGALQKDNVNVDNVMTDPQNGSGKAFILLQANSQNSILVYAGANKTLSPSDIDNAKDTFEGAEFLAAQFETPVVTTVYAFKYAKAHGIRTILNPAPAVEQISPELARVTDLVCPNETEAAILTDIKITDYDSMQAAAHEFFKMGIKHVIITVGERGAFYADASESYFVNAYKVHAIDTTAAGDTFIGALCSQLKPDFSNMHQAIQFANLASSITVQHLGAQPAIPTLEQIKAEAKKHHDYN